MVSSNSDKNYIYGFYNGEVDELIEEVRGFCASTYGDKCEFREVEVQRSKSGSSWTLHSFDLMKEDAVSAMKRHLRTSIDSVKVKFGGQEGELELRICRAGNSSVVSRFIGNDEVAEAGEEKLVVVALDGETLEIAGEFLEGLK